MLRYFAIFWGVASLLAMATSHSHATGFTKQTSNPSGYGSSSNVYFCKVSQDDTATDTVLKDYPICLTKHRKTLPNWGTNDLTLSYGLRHL